MPTLAEMTSRRKAAKAKYTAEEQGVHDIGRSAFEAGKAVYNCPHRVGSKLDAAWRRGWFERRDEIHQRDHDPAEIAARKGAE